MNRFARVALGIFGGMALTGQVASAATFSDSNPITATNGGNWSPVVSTPGGLYVLNTGSGYLYYDSSATANNLLITGFPHGESSADIFWGVGSRYNPGSVTPSATPVGTVDFQVIAQKGSPDGFKIAALLMQGGKFYRSAFQTELPTDPFGNKNFSGAGLTAANFGEFEGLSYDYGTDGNNIPADGRADFTSNPDFVTGGAITFGYLSHYETSLKSAPEGDSPAAYLMTTDFTMTFNDAPIPEPTSAMVLGLCLIPALARRRRA